MSKVVKVFPDRLPPFFLPRLVGRNGFLLRRDTSSSKIHCCYIIISTEPKKRYTVEQDEFFCCVIISSGFKEKTSYVTKTKECRKKKIVPFSSSRALDPCLLLEGLGPLLP